MFGTKLVDFLALLAGGKDTCYWITRTYFSSVTLEGGGDILGAKRLPQVKVSY